MPLTPDQIAEMDALSGVGQQQLQALTPEMMAEMDAIAGIQPEPAEDGLGADLRRRVEQAGEIKRRFAAGEMGEGSAALQALGGVGFGTMGDILGAGLGQVGRGIAAVTPEAVKEPVAEFGRDILESDIGQAGLSALQAGGEAWGSFRESYPDVARNLEALGNVAAFTPAGAVTVAGARQVAPLAGRAIRETGRIAAKPVTIPARAIREKITGGDIDILTPEQLGRVSARKYKEIEEVGELLPPEISGKFLTKKAEIEKARIGDELVPESVERFTKETERYKALAGKELSFDDVEKINQELGDKITASIKEGKPTRETGLLLELQEDLRGSIDDLPEGALARDAREVYRAKMKTDDISRIIERAGMTQNTATGIISGFRTLYNSKKIRGYTTKEKEMIKALAEGGGSVDLLRSTIGSRLISNMVGVVSGGLPGVATATAVSAAARGGAEALQVRKALKVLEELQRPTKEIIKSDKIKLLQRRIKAGEKVSKKEIMKLPPKDAKKLLEQMKKGAK